MPRVSATGLAGATGNKPLDNGWYDFTIVTSKVLEKDDGKMTWEVHSRVDQGDVQKDGGDATGRQITQFYPLSGYESMKDGGRFVRNRIHDFLEAIGITVESDDSFDTDEAEGAKYRGLNRNSADLNGELREQLTSFRPL